jgi:hypothetical protein
MSKERRTVSLEPEVDAYLSRDGVNASELVNSLVKKSMNGTDTEDALKELRKQQIRSDIQELQTRMESRREELDTIKDLEEEQQKERESQLQEAISKAKDAPRDPENPAIQTQAEKVGMSPEEFIDELPENNDDDLRSV